MWCQTQYAVPYNIRSQTWVIRITWGVYLKCTCLVHPQESDSGLRWDLNIWTSNKFPRYLCTRSLRTTALEPIGLNCMRGLQPLRGPAKAPRFREIRSCWSLPTGSEPPAEVWSDSLVPFSTSGTNQKMSWTEGSSLWKRSSLLPSSCPHWNCRCLQMRDHTRFFWEKSTGLGGERHQPRKQSPDQLTTVTGPFLGSAASSHPAPPPLDPHQRPASLSTLLPEDTDAHLQGARR